MFTRGRRLFTTASLATILVSVLHTVGNTLSDTPTDAAYASMESAMRGYIVPLGLGMAPSVWDIYRCLVFTMSICLLAMGGLGLTLAASRDATPRLLSRAAMVLATGSAMLTLLSLTYRIPPPLISMAVVTVLFVAAIPQRRV
jgi:hypothetical protein